jgi:threonine/homoserine/homoserine lactone efflux protein
MIELSSYLLYLAACVALILVPGPAQALVLARTLAGGRRAGGLTALGLNVGTLFHTVAAALGLSAILATSALAFSVVKYIGAAYLIYLGIKALLSGAPAASTASPSSTKPASALGQAVATGVLNPKVALFFLAFLPQFVEPSHGHLFLQFLVLGATMAVLDTLYELALVLAFSRLRSRYLGNGKFALWQSRVSGVVLIALGVRLAAQSR